MNLYRIAIVFALVSAASTAQGGVVINEILYHAPDDLDDLQFIELHNTGDQAVDLSGWKFSKGINYTFPAGSKIEASGYLLICKNKNEFKTRYGFEAGGEYRGTLSHKGEALELVDAKGQAVDGVTYGSRAPWPLAADGHSSSLERICPNAPGNTAENWAPSPLSSGVPKPGGTPGRRNSCHAARPLPVVSEVSFTPPHVLPNQTIDVRAAVAGDAKVVELRYRVAGSGYEKDESVIPMTKGAGNVYAASIPPQKAGQIVRCRIRAVDANGGERYFPHPNEVRPAQSVFVHEKFDTAAIPLGFIINVGATEFRDGQREEGPAFGAPPRPEPPARGNSAFVYVNPKTRVPELFDFVSIPLRTGGRKIHFHKDRPLGDMTTINLVFEYMDRFPIAETMAYELYRKAGVPCPRTDFVRTWIDGRGIGFQLLIEQPNKAFLRHNTIDDNGNLYKANWTGNDLVARHEKKTHTRAGHDDLVKLADQINRSKGDAQWAVIKKEFDVEEMINHYAVRTILSDWDGFFNNYYLYHDTGRTKKWMLFPWDQDKTWGFFDGASDVFFHMPITFGMEGDRPVGGGWWRPGGDFARPLLANPTFRKHFLARTKDLLKTVYTEETFNPIIQALGDKLEAEVKVRAELRRENPQAALDNLKRNLNWLREHLKKRRDFLLKQDEIQKAGPFNPKDLK